MVVTPEQAKANIANWDNIEKAKNPTGLVRNASDIINQENAINNPNTGAIKNDFTKTDTTTAKPVVTPTIQEQPQVTAEQAQQNLKQWNDYKAPETVEQPQVDTTTVKTENTPNGKITTTEKPIAPVNQDLVWKQGDAIQGMDKLERIVENNNGVVATQKDGKVIATLSDGKTYEWTVGPDGNPHKSEIGTTPVNTNDFLNKLTTGGQIEDMYKSNSNYVEAKHIFDETYPYRGASADTLYSAMSTNKLVPGSDLYNHLIQANGGVETSELLEAKAKYQQKIKTDFINKDIDINSGTNTKTPDALKDISDQIIKAKGLDYAQEFTNEVTNNPDIAKLATDLNDTSGKINELERAKRKTLDKIIADHPGISIGMASGLAQNENGDLDDELFLLYNKKATQQANLDYKTNLATKMYDIKVDQNKQNIADLQKEQDYQRGLTRTADQRAYEEQQATKQLEQQAQYKFGDISSTNPTLQNIAIQNAVADMYTRYPLPGMESQATKIQKVKDLIAQGKTGAEAIARVEQEIRNNPRYADYLASEKAKLNPTTQDWTKLDDNTLYNQKTGETKPIGTSQTSNVVSTGNMTQVQNNGQGQKNLTVDSVAKQPLIDALNSIGIKNYVVGAQQYRTPEEQAKLVAEGKSWTNDSKHLSGLAIDLYSPGKNGKLEAPTKDVVDKMNAQGWYQPQRTISKGDYGHFEYTGNNNAKSEMLTDKQFTQSNQVITGFKSDPQVKAFEETYSQGLNLITSLQSKTGPGDVAGVYQFMKSLDPTSVVRESEFNIAAKSAGVTGYLGNTWDRIMKGKKLTDKQAEVFGKLAKRYIENKAKIYDTKYADGIKRLQTQGINSKSVFPTNLAEQMRQALNGDNQGGAGNIDKNDVNSLVNNYF